MDFKKLEKLVVFDHLGKNVQDHLKKVYSGLSITLLAATAGAYVHLFTSLNLAGLLTVLVSLGLLLAIHFTEHTPQNESKRFCYLLGFGFTSGIGLGPLLDMAIRIDPSIVPTALMGTAAIFICFSLASLLTRDRKFIFLGGTLMSGLSIMLMMNILNIFMGSRIVFEAQLYLGFLVMCGFVLYDTQLIVEKRHMGDDDYIKHCLELFIDCIQLFRYLLIILANKEEKKKRRN